MEYRTVHIEYLPTRAATRLIVPGSERVVEVTDVEYERAQSAVRVMRRLLESSEVPNAPDWAIAAGRVWSNPHHYRARVVRGECGDPECDGSCRPQEEVIHA